MSRTFEGRDRFAPVAGALARGVPLSELGAPVHVWTRLPPDRPRVEAAAIHGRVVRVDHFGNVITNIGRDLVDAWRMGADIVAGLGVHAVAGLVETYASGRPGTPCLLFDSNDHLELAVPLGSAAVMLGVRPGDAVTVSRRTERPC
jgi:S-adenosylmethionine hydrolase